MSETHEGPPPIAGDRRGKRDMLWGRCFCWDKGAFHFRPLLILAAAALWWIAGFDWAAGALDVVHNMDLNKVLRFIAVVCAFCSFNWSLRIVREIHIVLTVLVCLPLSLIGAFFFAALIFAGVFSLIFAGVLQMMEPGFLPFSLDTVGAVLSPIPLLGVFAAGSATSWLLAYYFVFAPYSLRSDHLLRSLPGSLQLMFVLWYRKSEGRDLAAARKASGCEGTLTRRDTAVLWTDCENLKLESCLATMERTSEILHRRLGRKLVADGTLRLFVFSRVDGMWRYAPTGGLFGLPRDYVGYYTRPFQPRIVFLRGLADLFPLDSHNYLAHEYVHYLHLQGHRSGLPLWLVEGLASWIAAEVAPPLPSLVLGHRRCWNYLMSSQSLLAGDELIKVSYLAGEPQLASEDVRRTCLREMALYSQSQCLFDWLYSHRRERLIEATLDPLHAPVAEPGQFLEQFEITPDEALANALEARRAAVEEPVIETSEAYVLREASVRQLYQIMSDTTATVASQRMALRLLPTLAFGLDAEPLRAFHRSSRGELKEVAALALDMLA